ncbi:MAG: fasciclin domain-containing protein [Kaiparowitsia implicata GSE-PSE-MK54-09C]|jgi:uncharacterized surface protein with fasciclin (FAS1) repeats|nr:fasciclin domain-containing protein [Kaiparowitsia implicata GSE-PSE-MK54-09C]
MLFNSKLSKRFMLGFVSLGAATVLAACAEPETDSQVETPDTTTEAPADGTYSEDPMAAEGMADEGTVADLVEQDESFSTLRQALEAADMTEVLDEAGPYTVFAPTNDAFAAVPQETLDALLLPENQEQLRQVLSYHVVAANVPSDQIEPGEVATVEGSAVNIAAVEGSVMVNEAMVTQPDITASNGVIHAIDQVLIPPTLNMQ